MFVVLLSFSKSLAHVAKVYDQTKCLLLNAEPCMVKPTLIDMNPVELKYDAFMISLNKCTAKSNIWSLEICVPKETKDINVKALNVVTNKNDAKSMTEHISCDCECKLNSKTCNSNQKWNNKTCQYECKNYRKFKKGYSWNPSTCICENSKY